MLEIITLKNKGLIKQAKVSYDLFQCQDFNPEMALLVVVDAF